MIPQGYPLYAVDEDGGLFVVVGWLEVGFRPVVVGLNGVLGSYGKAYHHQLQYFTNFDQAERNTDS